MLVICIKIRRLSNLHCVTICRASSSVLIFSLRYSWVNYARNLHSAQSVLLQAQRGICGVFTTSSGGQNGDLQRTGNARLSSRTYKCKDIPSVSRGDVLHESSQLSLVLIPPVVRHQVQGTLSHSAAWPLHSSAGPSETGTSFACSIITHYHQFQQGEWPAVMGSWPTVQAQLRPHHAQNKVIQLHSPLATPDEAPVYCQHR